MRSTSRLREGGVIGGFSRVWFIVGNAAIRAFSMDRINKVSSKKKPLDVELIFSPPRRILAQLTEAVSVKAVLRDVGKCLAIHEE